MAYFHCQTRIRIRIRTPSPMVTLYYAELCPLVRIWIQIPVRMASQMVTVPMLGTDLHPRDRSPSQFYYISIRGLESKSEPVEKFCIVQESVSVSESESVSGSGNKPLQSHLSSAFSFARLWLMAHLHCRRRTRIPNLMATLYYGEHVHIAQTLCVCIGQESESVSISESVSGNIKEPLQPKPSTSEGNRETEKNYCFFRQLSFFIFSQQLSINYWYQINIILGMSISSGRCSLNKNAHRIVVLRFWCH